MVTGGSRGIGLAIAGALAQAGYAVVISGRNEKALQSALKELQVYNKSCSGVVCDVRVPASVQDLFRKIEAQYEHLDVLINNAGVAHALTPIEKLALEAWDQVIDTNLNALFLVTRAALPLMTRGGTIVNNLSVAASQPFPGMAAYNASKYGALGFTKVLREEVRERGIRVLALLPGATNTDIWGQFWPDAPKQEMIAPESVAQAVLHAVTLPANTAIEELHIGPTAGKL